MTRRLFIILLSMLPIAAGASSFDDVVSEVMSNNLTGRAEAARAGAQVEGILGENTLESPEVEFSRVWGTTAEAGNKWSLAVSQSFDWPGVYAARREAARTARTASQYLIESTLLDLRQEVSTLLVDIIHNTQLIEMQSQLVDRMNELEAYYKKAADAGSRHVSTTTKPCSNASPHIASCIRLRRSVRHCLHRSGCSTEATMSMSL